MPGVLPQLRGGALGEAFRQAGAELGWLWALLPARDPAALAGEVLALLDSDGYGVTDRLLEAASPALGPDGRADLRRRLQERLAALPASRGRADLDGWHGRGLLSFRLGGLADLEGDVDAFIAAAEAGGCAETLAGDIAGRLIAHDRVAEALTWLDRAPARHEGKEFALADLRIAALDALGRKADAQSLRWAAFERWLGAAHLRAYLRGLLDFDDVEAQDQAVAHALAHPDRNLALSFLVGWPNLEAAARLVRPLRRTRRARPWPAPPGSRSAHEAASSRSDAAASGAGRGCAATRVLAAVSVCRPRRQVLRGPGAPSAGRRRAEDARCIHGPAPAGVPAQDRLVLT